MSFIKEKTGIEQLLSAKLETEIVITDIKPVGGGSVNTTFIFKAGNLFYFLKENSRTRWPGMFRKEMSGLNELAKCRSFYSPKPLLLHETEARQYLVMECLENVTANTLYYEQLGKGVSDLHRITNKHFGFTEDNYIGSLPQANAVMDNWPDFFSMQRLHPLVKWSYDEKLISKITLGAFENLYTKLGEIFPPEPPCLLHGDLWNGNAMNTTKGPALYDPAVYYGHREMDLAMTRLFGGFDEAFYRAYEAYFPLEKNFRQRTDICNLYPLLVHVKLFGTGYLQDVLSVIKRF
ncbi:MAG: fructosamine kinase family protein [Bacteroidia bacterium]